MTPLIDLLQAGGAVAWILAALSVAAISVAIFKIAQFWLLFKLGSSAADEALQHIEQQRLPEAILLTKGHPNLRARTVYQTLRLHEIGGLNPAQLREESIRRARLLVAQLTGHLRTLEVIASMAPLLGLFGTVLGMIEAFRAMEAAGSQVNPAILSGGIWVALLTTAIGLAVAMPVSMLHSWLERRAEVEAAGIQDALERTLTLCSSNPPHATKSLRSVPA